MQHYKLVFALTALTLLSGCNDRVTDVIQKMNAIRAQPAAPIEPPPIPEPVQAFVYGAQDLRDPFMPPSFVHAQAQMLDNYNVHPDPNRTREPLENFDLSELTFRGAVVVDGITYVLIQRPDGAVDNLTIGNYLGQNEGRIAKICSRSDSGNTLDVEGIQLDEIVPDPRFGFVPRDNYLPASAASVCNPADDQNF